MSAFGTSEAFPGSGGSGPDRGVDPNGSISSATRLSPTTKLGFGLSAGFHLQQQFTKANYGWLGMNSTVRRNRTTLTLDAEYTPHRNKFPTDPEEGGEYAGMGVTVGGRQAIGQRARLRIEGTVDREDFVPPLSLRDGVGREIYGQYVFAPLKGLDLRAEGCSRRPDGIAQVREGHAVGRRRRRVERFVVAARPDRPLRTAALHRRHPRRLELRAPRSVDRNARTLRSLAAHRTRRHGRRDVREPDLVTDRPQLFGRYVHAGARVDRRRQVTLEGERIMRRLHYGGLLFAVLAGNAPLVSAATLNGRVTGPGGLGVFPVDIDVRDSNTQVLLVTSGDTTNATGNYAITVPTGRYDLTFKPTAASHLFTLIRTSINVTTITTTNVAPWRGDRQRQGDRLERRAGRRCHDRIQHRGHGHAGSPGSGRAHHRHRRVQGAGHAGDLRHRDRAHA
jgi:hypothetical protein